MKKNNIYFVTGAGGFIGRHLVDKLAKEGSHVRCLVRRDRHKDLWKSKNITTVLGDLQDRDSLENAIGNANFCIHLASVINSKNKAEFEDVNVRGMSNMIDVSLGANIEKFVYVSSIDAELVPHSLYGGTKLAAEKKLKESSLNYTILRSTVVYGQSDDKHISSLIKFIGHSPLVPIFGDGYYKRQPVYVGDLIYAIKKCIELEGTTGKIYDIAGPSALTMNEIVQTILRVLGKKRMIVHLPIAPVKRLCLVLGKINRFLRTHSQQILSIDQDKLADIGSAQGELSFKPIGFEHGLRTMLKGDQ
ncbi:MAG: NAD-dependent epimerase/dehydratase family protein [Candidatus Omnitrophica bacterium]|nr:NAD-dependent epimerase/dehydratase family protein [Candidatus Omnitrophota bacterium]